MLYSEPHTIPLHTPNNVYVENLVLQIPSSFTMQISDGSMFSKRFLSLIQTQFYLVLLHERVNRTKNAITTTKFSVVPPIRALLCSNEKAKYRLFSKYIEPISASGLNSHKTTVRDIPASIPGAVRKKLWFCIPVKPAVGFHIEIVNEI
ncbi:hypothetical protein C0J52_14978 [Blattella germanica]|nr:hypothetical protein C0J52_14978 [Blattella germanica]